MRVLFVQQDHVSPTGPVGEAFAKAGYEMAEFGVVPASRFHDPPVTVTFPDPLAFDAIVPTGAAWSVYDRDRIGTWIDDELSLLRRPTTRGCRRWASAPAPRPSPPPWAARSSGPNGPR